MFLLFCKMCLIIWYHLTYTVKAFSGTLQADFAFVSDD